MTARRRLASPFLLLVAMLVAASVLLVHDARPAAADHGDEETYWSATLTVKSWGAAGVARGCSNAEAVGKKCSQTSVLTDDDFTYGGTSYDVTLLRQVATDDEFVVIINKPLPAILKEVAVLYVDGTAHPLAGATATASTGGGQQLAIPTSSVAWSAGDTVTLELKRPAAPASGVELAGTDLDTSRGAGHFDLDVTEGASASFTVALSGDPGTDASITLVNTQYFQSDVGDSDHRWNMNAATVMPQTLTFTAGTSGNWSTPQTVTVTGADDADSCSEQLIVLLLSTVSNIGYDYVYVGPGNGTHNRDAQGNYVWAGSNMGEYVWQLVDGHAPAGGDGASVTGVYVKVADNDGGSCGGV